jgi:hypothetical protein
MKKLLALLLLSCTLLGTVLAQKSKTPPPAPRPVPKGPPPYVLKKDYDPQIKELNGKVSAASAAASAVKKSVETQFAKVNQLDSEVQNIQAILNSTNFLLSVNADSIKETRITMDELAQKTDTNFNHIEETNASLSRMLWIFLGASLVASMIVLIVLLTITGKRLSKVQVMLLMSEEVLKKSISSGLERNQQEFKDGLDSIQSKIGVETAILRRELSQQLNKEQEATHQSIELLLARIEKMEQTSKQADTDPEVFI